jgi:hypothetical protein
MLPIGFCKLFCLYFVQICFGGRTFTGYGRKGLVNYYLVAVKLTSSALYRGDKDTNSCWDILILFSIHLFGVY